MFLFFLYLHGEDSGFNSEVLLNTVCLYFMFFTNPLLLSMSVHLSYCSVVYLFAFQWSRSFRGVFGETNQSELAAFTSYALAFPNNFLALVDTYDVSKAFANYLVMFNYLTLPPYKRHGFLVEVFFALPHGPASVTWNMFLLRFKNLQFPT